MRSRSAKGGSETGGRRAKRPVAQSETQSISEDVGWGASAG